MSWRAGNNVHPQSETPKVWSHVKKPSCSFRLILTRYFKTSAAAVVKLKGAGCYSDIFLAPALRRRLRRHSSELQLPPNPPSALARAAAAENTRATTRIHTVSTALSLSFSPRLPPPSTCSPMSNVDKILDTHVDASADLDAPPFLDWHSLIPAASGDQPEFDIDDDDIDDEWHALHNQPDFTDIDDDYYEQRHILNNVAHDFLDDQPQYNFSEAIGSRSVKGILQMLLSFAGMCMA